ncbi:hypothetical protein TC41_0406 [Alicyclobacillus acidocaldarius subsp. acidocaldarius Tc-4-1]|uniref:Uncharacterized protein n=1 Tax=Alicyclobacillus acidocaldarius (strain Tc-4-1) TaxID=1048834 RepID=F8IKZ0_ALIAT|nr:hypothetical protein TC41_0406 [Alicyclobacillus acidocaldarius subsp. acidocaldarius Tc-4-1]
MHGRVCRICRIVACAAPYYQAHHQCGTPSRYNKLAVHPISSQGPDFLAIVPHLPTHGRTTWSEPLTNSAHL